MRRIIIAISLLSIFLCGCQGKEEINNLSIVNAIGIEVNDNNEFDISIQILDTTKNNTDEQENLKKTIVYTSQGSNISEALSGTTLKSPKRLYLGHLSLLVVGEELAKENIDRITDFFLRNNKVGKNFSVMISKETSPKEILEQLEGENSFPTGNILGSVEVSSILEGNSSNVKFTKFMQDLVSEGKNPVLPAIKKVDENDNKLIIDDIGVFKNNKLVGYLSNNENIGYNFITDNIKSTTIDYKCDDENYISINITKSSTEMKSKISNDKPIIDLKVKANASISEVNCSKGAKDLNKVKKETEKRIEKIIQEVINKTKEDINSDIFGFGKEIYQNHYFYWKDIKDDWDKIYPSLQINLDVNVELDDQGSIVETAR